MQEIFSLPEGVIGRFAVVKLWSAIKTAEDECIARLKFAAQAIGVECIEILADGSLLTNPKIKISKANVDFVIHLHYDTPKRYDAFSFVALWNPLNFYLEWGYRRTSRNLTTHDDFLSCSSDPADHHIARMVRSTCTHLPPKFRLYHSTADVIHTPSLGDGKLLYVGINWEAISGGKSRHQEVLKLLDKTGLLRIYGPHIFQGVQVWAGYDSYVREVPFDGVSLVNEISKAGAVLVFSSQSHKEAALMSNRLFESVAAGALVICDENPFAKKFFGDSLLYIDSRSTPESIVEDIQTHLAWAQANPSLALSMIAKSQEIFREKFTLIRNLSALYAGLRQRQQELLALQCPSGTPWPRVHLHLLMPAYSEAVLRAHIESVCMQDYSACSFVLVVDRLASRIEKSEVKQLLAESKTPIELVEIDYFNYGIHPEIKAKRCLGEVIQSLLGPAQEAGAEAFMVVAPNEKLFSNHVSVLAYTLQRSPEVHCAATAAVLTNGDAPVHSVHELIDFGHVDRQGPPGLGRFIFRLSAIPKDIAIALPYLDGRPLAVLVGDHPIAQQLPASIVIDLQHEFPERTWNEAAENEIIRDFSPGAFDVKCGFGPKPEPVVPLASAIPAQGMLPPMTTLQLLVRLLSPRVVAAQIQAIRDYGLRTRLKVFKRRLGL